MDLSNLNEPNEEEQRLKSTRHKQEDTTPRNQGQCPLPAEPLTSPIRQDTLHHLRPLEINSKLEVFACPFEKRNAKNNRTRKYWTCCSRGRTIHRLKEHLLRTHAPAKHQCSRCLSEFKTLKALRHHFQSLTGCDRQASNEKMNMRIDQQQKKQLKTRSRRSSDEDKWYNIYRILFPHDSAADIPSPYYEATSSTGHDVGSRPGADYSLSQFQYYLHNRLQDPNVTQQNMEKINSCLDLFQAFRNAAADTPSPVSEVPSLSPSNSGFSPSRCQPNTSDTSLTMNKRGFSATHGFENMGSEVSTSLGLSNDFFGIELDKATMPGASLRLTKLTEF
ncbi:hypothetical protein F5Y01DRAFT_296490 [Xylaria sp. FL0043]|nr:hypothetical protein F5Y01DRAFT_296490 [Xylaria sp. FL0043]